MRQKATALYRESGDPGMLTHLLQTAANDRILEVYALTADRRPTETLKLAEEILRNPEIVGIRRNQIESMAGGAAQTLGDLAKAQTYFESVLAGSPDGEDRPMQAKAAMSLAVNAMLAAVPERASNLLETAEGKVVDLDAETRCHCQFEKFIIAYYRCGQVEAGKLLAEIEALPRNVEAEDRRLAIELALEMHRLSLLAWKAEKTEERHRLLDMIAEARARGALTEYYRLFLDANEVLLLAYDGTGYGRKIEALEREIAVFLAARAPADVAELRNEISILARASLAAGDLVRAEIYIGQMATLAYPVGAATVAVARGELHLARGDRETARRELHAALAMGMNAEAEQEARELLARAAPAADRAS